VIACIDNQTVDARTVSKLLQDHAVGETVTLTIIRFGELRSLTLTLEKNQPHFQIETHGKDQRIAVPDLQKPDACTRLDVGNGTKAKSIYAQ
jgi:hypothetical protein